MSDLRTLRPRLEHSDAAVRRTAILDLARLGDRDPAASVTLLDHLPRETDERARVLIARHLGAVRYIPAKPALWALYADRSTPVRVAHAAVLAHDQIEGGETRAGC